MELNLKRIVDNKKNKDSFFSLIEEKGRDDFALKKLIIESFF
jgi:hypothetical protein